MPGQMAKIRNKFSNPKAKNVRYVYLVVISFRGKNTVAASFRS